MCTARADNLPTTTAGLTIWQALSAIAVNLVSLCHEAGPVEANVHHRPLPHLRDHQRLPAVEVPPSGDAHGQQSNQQGD